MSVKIQRHKDVYFELHKALSDITLYSKIFLYMIYDRCIVQSHCNVKFEK